MQAINAKTTEQIKAFLDYVAADMEIINYNIRESGLSETQKAENIKLVTQLRQDIYNVMEKLK